MSKIRLVLRTACKSNRGGFTLVELLVVIGIIAILAGVALGPITNGIKQAKHNTAMQNARSIGSVCFQYATDNNSIYPADTTSEKIANTLLNSNYCNDPTLFLIAGTPSKTAYAASGSTAALTASNISWNFSATAATTGSGLTSNTSDLIPVVFFTGVSAPFPATPGTGKPITLVAACPFGTDGIAIAYKGNNAAYVKSGTTTPAQVDNFLSASCADTTTYVTIVP